MSTESEGKTIYHPPKLFLIKGGDVFKKNILILAYGHVSGSQSSSLCFFWTQTKEEERSFSLYSTLLGFLRDVNKVLASILL